MSYVSVKRGNPFSPVASDRRNKKQTLTRRVETASLFKDRSKLISAHLFRRGRRGQAI